MARKDKPFSVSPFATEAGRRGLDVSLNEPIMDQADVYGNRLKFIYNQQGALSPAQQDYYQRMQNQLPMYTPTSPSVDLSPSVSPFPIGYPTGMYQQGNVCIPKVGTYPGTDDFAPPAGQNFAKGQFYQIVSPKVTTRGQLFNTESYFRNVGAIRGKFFIRWKIPDLGITDQVSTGTWVPQFANGVIYKNITMPMSAPQGQTVNAQVELLKLDETTNELTVDDVTTAAIPTPGTTVPTDDDGIPVPPSSDCYVIGGINYCLATVAVAGCVSILGKIYCPAPGGTPTPPSTTPATLLTSPVSSIEDGQVMSIVGNNFGQYEVVDLKFEATAHSTSRPEWEGKRYVLDKAEQCDYSGKFTESVQMPTLASGVWATAPITCKGRTTLKQAITTINIT